MICSDTSYEYHKLYCKIVTSNFNSCHLMKLLTLILSRLCHTNVSWVAYSKQVNIDGSFALLRVSLQRCIKKKNSLTKHIFPLVANIFILRFTIFKFLGEFSGVFLRK